MYLLVFFVLLPFAINNLICCKAKTITIPLEIKEINWKMMGLQKFYKPSKKFSKFSKQNKMGSKIFKPAKTVSHVFTPNRLELQYGKYNRFITTIKYQKITGGIESFRVLVDTGCPLTWIINDLCIETNPKDPKINSNIPKYNDNGRLISSYENVSVTIPYLNANVTGRYAKDTWMFGELKSEITFLSAHKVYHQGKDINENKISGILGLMSVTYYPGSPLVYPKNLNIGQFMN